MRTLVSPKSLPHARFRLVVAVGLVLAFSATALGGNGKQVARPKTLAKVDGRVNALAQDGNRIAWMKSRWRSPLQILTLPARRPVVVGSGPHPDANGCDHGCDVTRAIAVSANGRVVWEELVVLGNTYLGLDLFTAAVGAARMRFAADSEMGIEDDNPDWTDPLPDGLPLAADGNAILYYADCFSPGCRRARTPAIYRLVGRRSKLLSRTTRPVGLAVEGRRYAVVTNSLRCCSFTPTWSRDGTNIAWVYHGNLWTIRGDGTGDRQVAAGVSPVLETPDSARRPSWSTDGSQLVFERTAFRDYRLRSLGVYRVDATGRGSRRLTGGSAPAWSPDGTLIAFVRGGGVFAIKPDGTGERRLTTTARKTAGPLSWSPDSTRIAVSRGGDIYSVRADGTGESRLTTTRRAEAQPAWSPDGARIAYLDGSKIAVINADGTGATSLRSEGGSPTWSPDSKRIAFLSEGMWVVNADGTGRRRLAWSRQPLDAPQWSPTGNAIVVGEYADPDNGLYPHNPGIRLVSALDGKARKIAPVPRSPVEIRDTRTGRLVKRFAIEGHASTVALGSGYAAFLVNHEPGVRIDLYNLNGTLRKGVAVPAGVQTISAAGRNVVFATGVVIRRLDARTGVVSVLTTARRRPVGLTIEGRRVVWAENLRGGARIRSLIVR
jgi:TolB protein